MKIAFAGKGGAGKTTLAAWTADYLARHGATVWMVDADTALSLGQASGLSADALPTPLVLREDLVRERIGSGCINLNPEVGDLPEALGVDLPVGADALTSPHVKVFEGEPEGEPFSKGSPSVPPGRKRLLVMGTVAGAGGGCACAANALLKALLAHLVIERGEWVVVDLEAGVEHLGRGTAAHVDGLVVVSEASRRSLETAASIGRLAGELGLGNQVLALNRCQGAPALPGDLGLPPLAACFPALAGLEERQLRSASVLGLPEQEEVDALVERTLGALGKKR